MKLQQNGATWYDTQGNVLHAHGGYIIQHEGVYYWYGENRLDNIYVDCYASTDLVNWEFRNHVLTTDSPTEKSRVRADLNLRRADGGKVNIERPKVLYCKKTGKFVMWMHYENGVDYLCAAAAVATCDTPDGDFVYHGSFNPYGQMARDCTLFRDGDRDYFMAAARDNADMNIYRLQDDLMNVEKWVASSWSGEYREAPAVVKKDDTYYCLSSFCTGWKPNQGKYAYTKNFEDGFGRMDLIGDETTYRSQPAFILKIEGTEETSYIYVGDRWAGGYGAPYHDSRYLWFPLLFKEDGSVEMVECDYLDIDVKTGKMSWE